jgi:hypothetical protein
MEGYEDGLYYNDERFWKNLMISGLVNAGGAYYCY